MATRNISSIHCGFINIQSVGNKTVEIHELMLEKSFDVFCVAETWLHDGDMTKCMR